MNSQFRDKKSKLIFEAREKLCSTDLTLIMVNVLKR